MDLSIIIVNYNTRALTLQCIDSIFTNKLKAKFEVLVLDNGSADGSLEDLRKDKRIILFENKANLGFSKANNIGIQKSKGKYILLLNSDTKLKEHAISVLIRFAQKTPDAGAVASRLLNADGSIQGSVFRLPTLGRAIRHYWLGEKNLLDKYAPQGHKPKEVEVAVMAAFLITPKALKEVGMLNESYFFYFEDFDYCRAINKKGLKVYYLPSSEVFHYHGASGKRIVDEANQWRRLIPSSKIYHGLLGHYVFNFVIWSSQKWQKLIHSF